MADTLQDIRRKMDRARQLGSLVRTMKLLAASSVSQYERAIDALADYQRAVQQGLSICLKTLGTTPPLPHEARVAADGIGAIVFGSDQGLVGQFNDVIAEFVLRSLGSARTSAVIWSIGERIRARLAMPGVSVPRPLAVPNSVNTIAPLVQQLMAEIETELAQRRITIVYVFHHRIRSGALYEPVRQRLLPFDANWREEFIRMPWPTRNLPEIAGPPEPTIRALIGEYLFVSLFRASADSLASENASRLAAMQRAQKNIGELLEDFGRRFNDLRQASIDAELFDVVAGFEALSNDRRHQPARCAGVRMTGSLGSLDP
jgi:F-type H+-transporting ATPase subunit gamma